MLESCRVVAKNYSRCKLTLDNCMSRCVDFFLGCRYTQIYIYFYDEIIIRCHTMAVSFSFSIKSIEGERISASVASVSISKIFRPMRLSRVPRIDLCIAILTTALGHQIVVQSLLLSLVLCPSKQAPS